MESKKLLTEISRIREIMKLPVNEVSLMQLNKTNYSNLKYDSDATQTDSVNKSLLDDINAAAKKAGLVATITTAKSGHGTYTKGSKNVSRHMNGTGVDVAILNGLGAGGATNATNGNATFKSLGNKLKDALVSMGYTWNKESGQEKAVLWQTNIGGNHFNHLHISSKSDAPSAGVTPQSNQTSTTDNKTQTSTTTKTSTTDNKGETKSTDKEEPEFNIFDIFRDGNEENVKKVVGQIFPFLKESYNVGRNVKTSGKDYIVPSSSNSYLKSPVEGRIIKFKPMGGCSNQIAINHVINKQNYVLLYCNTGRQQKSVGEYVRIGETIGSPEKDKNVTVRLYDKNWRQISFDDVATPSKDKEVEKGREKDVKILPSYPTKQDVKVLPSYPTKQDVKVLPSYPTKQPVEVLPSYPTKQPVEFLPKYK